MKRLRELWQMLTHRIRTGHRWPCDGSPFHNGMCECKCQEHYLGL